MADTLNTVGTYAGAASQAYNAAASKNYAQALAIGAAAFGAPKGVTSALETAAKVETAVHAIEDGQLRDGAGRRCQTPSV